MAEFGGANDENLRKRQTTDAGVFAFTRVIVPSDVTDLADGPARGMICIAAGNVAFEGLDFNGSTRTSFPSAAVALWQVIPVAVYKVLATGTTATMVAGW